MNEQSKEEPKEEGEERILPKRSVWKPSVENLADAVVEGKFVVPVGKRIIIQYPENWRDSVVWTVEAVMDETLPIEEVVHEERTLEGTKRIVRRYVKGTTCAPGHVRLLDAKVNQYSATNYLSAATHGLLMKVWPDSGAKTNG